MKEFWYSEVVSNFDLKKDSMIFDYDEVLVGEFYLDTLFVFSDARGEGIGNKLLTEFVNSGEAKLSLNVAHQIIEQESYTKVMDLKKNVKFLSDMKNYDHLIRRK